MAMSSFSTALSSDKFFDGHMPTARRKTNLRLGRNSRLVVSSQPAAQAFLFRKESSRHRTLPSKSLPPTA